MIGTIFDDYEVIQDVGRRSQNRYYLVRCKVCGHTKECGINNLRMQDNHHSIKNCRMDYYGAIVGKRFGDYVCKSVEYVSKTSGYRATMECAICGHKLVIHAGNIHDRKHSAYVCEEDYHRSMIGARYGDLEIIGTDKVYCSHAIMYNCRCVKCGIKSKETMAQLKRGIHHGTHCFKLIPNDEFKTAIFRRFNLMDQRCNNPSSSSYSHYGGRGIKLCYDSAVDLYFDFIDELRAHAAIYGLRNSTFDRIDVNGDYEKNNLRITTQKIQSTNTTRKKMFIIENGSERVLSDSAMECGRHLHINGHGVGNIVRGSAKTCGGWTLYRLVEPTENIDDIINNEGVTTNLVITN